MYAVYATRALHCNRDISSTERDVIDTRRNNENVVQARPIIEACPKSPELHQPYRLMPSCAEEFAGAIEVADRRQGHQLQQQLPRPRKARVHFSPSVSVHALATGPVSTAAVEAKETRTSPHQPMTHRTAMNKPPFKTLPHPLSTSFEPLSGPTPPRKSLLHRPVDAPLPFVTLQYKLQSGENRVRDLAPGASTASVEGAAVGGVDSGLRSRVETGGNDLRLIYVKDI